MGTFFSEIWSFIIDSKNLSITIPIFASLFFLLIAYFMKFPQRICHMLLDFFIDYKADKLALTFSDYLDSKLGWVQIPELGVSEYIKSIDVYLNQFESIYRLTFIKRFFNYYVRVRDRTFEKLEETGKLQKINKHYIYTNYV